MTLIYDYYQENQQLKIEIEQLKKKNQEYQNLIKKQKEIIQNLIKNNNGGKKLSQNQKSFLKEPRLETKKQ